MTITPLLKDFNSSITDPFEDQGPRSKCNLREAGLRLYQAAAVAFSAIGNYPFYGVASKFGSQYSSQLGGVLGASEFGSYFTFRIRNFEEIRQKFFSGSEIRHDRNSLEAIEVQGVVAEQATKDSEALEDLKGAKSKKWFSNCGDMVAKASSAGLGIIAQFPLMVLVYYGNGENLAYPIISGACEASFTILSLLMSFQGSRKTLQNHGRSEENHRLALINQINRFIDELPSKYNDSNFKIEIEDILSSASQYSDEERGRKLLALVAAANGLPEQQNSSQVARTIGFLIACYVTAVNGAVTYNGIKDWKDDQEVLAIFSTLFVSLANIQLLATLCMDSATNYYRGVRDLVGRRYHPPLAYAVAPKTWILGRIFSNAISWLSFGTTATAALEIDKSLVPIAPLSSALLLSDNMNQASDDALLWVASRYSKDARRFIHLHNLLTQLKSKVEEASAEDLRLFPVEFQQLQSRGQSSSAETPLLSSTN